MALYGVHLVFLVYFPRGIGSTHILYSIIINLSKAEYLIIYTYIGFYTLVNFFLYFFLNSKQDA